MSMFVRSLAGFFVCLAACMFPASGLAAPEEDASALLQKVWDRCAEKEDFVLRVAMRSVSFGFEGGVRADGGTPVGGGMQVRQETYETLRFIWREPGDCLMLYQTGAVIGSRPVGQRTLALSRVGDQGGRLLTWNPKSKGTTQEDFESEMLFNRAQGRVGRLMMDPVVAQVISRRGGPGYYRESARGLRVVGEENWSGVRLLRIDGQQGGMRSSFWIDPERSLIVRMRSSGSNGGMPGGRQSGDVIETIYEYDFARRITAADLDAFSSVREAAQAGVIEPAFESIEALAAWLREEERKLAEVKAPEPGAGGASSAAETAPGSQPAKSEPVREEQRLSAEQMAAIVLIEGEEGAGTGFVTRMRDLSFVVTNQHVIGGSRKLNVTTLAGVKIQVGAIFGAVGRDIAILRIEGDAPSAALKLSDDPLRTAKIGDKVVVVGNRRGGGVATQVSGAVQGVGPDKLEVDAAFQPGNSGSPIVHLESGEVIGLAAYSQTRRLDLLDGPAASSRNSQKTDEPKIEQRWFGFRIDGVSGWEAIDLARWSEQAGRVAAFRADSEAIYHAMLGRFDEARGSVGVRRVIERFEERAGRSGARQVQTAQDVGEFFRSLRALSDNGKRELLDGQYYDYFRSSLYWETSIPDQIRAREQLAGYLDRASENATTFLSRLRR